MIGYFCAAVCDHRLYWTLTPHYRFRLTRILAHGDLALFSYCDKRSATGTFTLARELIEPDAQTGSGGGCGCEQRACGRCICAIPAIECCIPAPLAAFIRGPAQCG